MVGAKGFEPSTSWSRTRRASQAALRPDMPRSAATSAPSAVLSLSQHLLRFYTSRDRNSSPSSVKCNPPLRQASERCL
jgi:hypothetical protein